MAYKGDPEKDLMVDYLDHKTMSFQTLIDAVQKFEDNCWRNKIHPKDVPVTVTVNNLHYAIPWYGISLGMGKGARVSIQYYSSDKCMPIVKDERPAEGEYWSSRGVSDGLDVSGFVKSKEAGLRLLRLVKYVLEKDECETWLDWRETEPEWIQFKFSAKEFDVNKLHELTKDTGIITEDIIKNCKL